MPFLGTPTTPLPRPQRLRPLAEEGTGVSPAGHHRLRLPGEERHAGVARDGSGFGGLGGGGEDGGRDRNSERYML